MSRCVWGKQAASVGSIGKCLESTNQAKEAISTQLTGANGSCMDLMLPISAICCACWDQSGVCMSDSYSS